MNIPDRGSSDQLKCGPTGGCVNRRRSIWRLVLVLGVVLSAPSVWAADGSVTIVSPRPNETVGSDVTVTWKQERAGKADHVHVFVDRGNMKPVKNGTSIVLRGLSKGTHDITVQAYSRDHEPLDASASVTVKVE